MDFFDRQEHARRQTHLLLIYFATAVLVIVVVTYVVFASLILPLWKPLPHGPEIHNILISIFWLVGEALYHPLDYLRWTWEPGVFAAFATGMALAIALGSFIKLRQLSSGGPAVAEMLGGRRVEPHSASRG